MVRLVNALLCGCSACREVLRALLWPLTWDGIAAAILLAGGLLAVATLVVLAVMLESEDRDGTG